MWFVLINCFMLKYRLSIEYRSRVFRFVRVLFTHLFLVYFHPFFGPSLRPNSPSSRSPLANSFLSQPKGNPTSFIAMHVMYEIKQSHIHLHINHAKPTCPLPTCLSKPKPMIFGLPSYLPVPSRATPPTSHCTHVCFPLAWNQVSYSHSSLHVSFNSPSFGCRFLRQPPLSFQTSQLALKRNS